MWSCDQSLVTVAFPWEKLSQPQFYKDFTWKTAFFEGWPWLKVDKFGLVLGMTLKFYTRLAKGLTLKVRTFLETNSNVCTSYRRETGKEAFLLPPSWIGLSAFCNKLFNKIISEADLAGVRGRALPIFSNLLLFCNPFVIWRWTNH